jgi:hypothetical protein
MRDRAGIAVEPVEHFGGPRDPRGPVEVRFLLLHTVGSVWIEFLDKFEVLLLFTEYGTALDRRMGRGGALSLCSQPHQRRPTVQGYGVGSAAHNISITTFYYG